MKTFAPSSILTTLLLVCIASGISARAQTTTTAVFRNHLTARITGGDTALTQQLTGYTILTLGTNGTGTPWAIQLLAWSKPSRQFIARTNWGLSRYDFQAPKAKEEMVIVQSYFPRSGVFATYTARGPYMTLMDSTGATMYWQGPSPLTWSGHAYYPTGGTAVIEDTTGTLTLDVPNTIAAQPSATVEGTAEFFRAQLISSGYTQTNDYLR